VFINLVGVGNVAEKKAGVEVIVSSSEGELFDLDVSSTDESS